MPQREDPLDTIEKQTEWMPLKLPGGLWVEMPDTWSNRRGLMIVLRCLRTAEGYPLVTYERLAEGLGYRDRRNVHHFWMEFEACGSDLEAFLVRRQKINAQGVARCEQIWRAHPLWNAVQVHAEFMRRWPQQGAGLREANIRTAGPHIGFLGIQQVLRRQLQEGAVGYREEGLIEQLRARARVGAQEPSDQAGAMASIPEGLESVSPQGPVPDLSERPPQRLVEQVETSLLSGVPSPSALAALWEGTTGWLMRMFVRYYHGLSLSVLGPLFGVHKTTGMRWLEPLAQVNWQGVVQPGKRFFSGTVAVDEKWVQIRGKGWYLLVAVDDVSGVPLYAKLLPSNAGDYGTLFLLQLKALGYQPKIIITDGWDA
jgi:hypothetical protein